MNKAKAQDKLIIPTSELEKLEAARIALYEMFPNESTEFYMKLQEVTQPMWELANRRWPEFKED